MPKDRTTDVALYFVHQQVLVEAFTEGMKAHLGVPLVIAVHFHKSFKRFVELIRVAFAVFPFLKAKVIMGIKEFTQCVEQQLRNWNVAVARNSLIHPVR